MTRDLNDYLHASPWEALLQLINDNCGLYLKPWTSNLISLDAINSEGETKVTIMASKSDDSLTPPFACRVFKYYRLDLAVVLADYDGGFIDPDNNVVDTRWVVNWLSEKTGIVFDMNDFQHIPVKVMESFVLKAHPMSLRWYGEITLTIAPSVDHARLEEPGTYRLRLKPGTYSVLVVGGGSGGTGVYPTEEDRTNGRMLLAGGGGSGYAAKGRITVNEGDSIIATVGKGGDADVSVDLVDWNDTTNNGSKTMIYADTHGGLSSVANKHNVLIEAGGAPGPKQDHMSFRWVYYTSGGRCGGCGASGGGKSSWFKGASFMGDRVLSFDYGHYGSNGGSDGTDADGTEIATNGVPWYVSGGQGVGKGYYTNIMNAIDPDITHDIPAGSEGGKCVNYFFKAYYKGNLLGNVKSSRAGGGGGMGSVYRGKIARINGQEYQIDGTGYGAGGGGGNPGVPGLVSIVKID